MKVQIFSPLATFYSGLLVTLIKICAGIGPLSFQKTLVGRYSRVEYLKAKPLLVA